MNWLFQLVYLLIKNPAMVRKLGDVISQVLSKFHIQSKVAEKLKVFGNNHNLIKKEVEKYSNYDNVMKLLKDKSLAPFHSFTILKNHMEKIKKEFAKVMSDEFEDHFIEKIMDVPNQARQKLKKLAMKQFKPVIEHFTIREDCWFSQQNHSDNVLEYGEFVLVDKDNMTGNLSIKFVHKNKGTFQSTHPTYTYQKIPYSVWYAMKNARLKPPLNGGKYLWGSMHIFWELVLYKFYRTKKGKTSQKLRELRSKASRILDTKNPTQKQTKEFWKIAKRFQGTVNG